MTCPKCGGNIPPGATSCGTCGSRFVKGIYCPHCRAVIPQTATVCPKCGKPIKRETTYIVPPETPKKKKPSKIASALASALLVFVVFGIIGTCTNSRKPEKSSNSQGKPSSSSTHPTKTPNPTPTPEPESTMTEAEIKDLAKKTDSEIMEICGGAWNEYSSFVSLLSQDGISELEVYRAAEAAKDSLQQFNLQINMVDISDLDIAKDYKDSAIIYVYSMLDTAKKTLKYIDDPVTSKLAKVQEAVEDVSNYVFLTATARVQFLSDAGFTDDEVNQIVESKADS